MITQQRKDPFGQLKSRVNASPENDEGGKGQEGKKRSVERPMAMLTLKSAALGDGLL
ncbi:MAG: hypothetical protein IPP96_14040 [Chitinophagaceae bacterium]|nr:hypothetical protein [Chitinophagaceae bacterium]